MKENRCYYCGKPIELASINDSGELLCMNCYISKEKIQQSERTLCFILGISIYDIFEFEKRIYKIKKVNFSLGKHIAIPCITQLNCYHKPLWEIKEDVKLNDIDSAFDSVADGRAIFEMIVENHKIKIIQADELYEKIVKYRSKLDY